MVLSNRGTFAKRNSLPLTRRSSEPGGATQIAVGSSQADVSTQPEFPGRPSARIGSNDRTGHLWIGYGSRPSTRMMITFSAS